MDNEELYDRLKTDLMSVSLLIVSVLITQVAPAEPPLSKLYWSFLGIVSACVGLYGLSTTTPVLAGYWNATLGRLPRLHVDPEVWGESA